jgi:hypothetical protein
MTEVEAMTREQALTLIHDRIVELKVIYLNLKNKIEKETSTWMRRRFVSKAEWIETLIKTNREFYEYIEKNKFDRVY